MGMQNFLTALALIFILLLPVAQAKAQSVRPPSNAVNQTIEEEAAPGNTLGSDSQSDYWRFNCWQY